MNKTLIIIPGFGEKITDPGYKKIANLAGIKGYKVTGVTVPWDRSVMTSWIESAKKQLEKVETKNSVVLGFSLGAYIAVMLAQEKSFKKILCCSLSPYFADDLSKIPLSAQKFFGKHRMEDFKRYQFPKNIKTPAVFFIGDADWIVGVERAQKSSAVWKGPKKLLILKGVEHNIDNPEYISAIEKQL